jgi:predicted phage gp36 major capsid-like protein
VFNIRDGLDEYDEDYTYFEKLGDIVTCDMKHHIEMKEQKEREALAREAEEIADEDLDSMESIEEEVDADLEAIEKFEDKDMLEERTEILADAELDPEFKQESKND